MTDDKLTHYDIGKGLTVDNLKYENMAVSMLEVIATSAAENDMCQECTVKRTMVVGLVMLAMHGSERSKTDTAPEILDEIIARLRVDAMGVVGKLTAHLKRT